MESILIFCSYFFDDCFEDFHELKELFFCFICFCSLLIAFVVKEAHDCFCGCFQDEECMELTVEVEVELMASIIILSQPKHCL